jgi:hypothetical protein
MKSSRQGSLFDFRQRYGLNWEERRREWEAMV